MPKLEEGLAERASETHRDRGKRAGKGLPLRRWLSRTCNLQKACKLDERSFPKRHPTSRALVTTPTGFAAAEIPGRRFDFRLGFFLVLWFRACLV